MLPFDPLLEHGAATGVVLVMNVGLVPALESAKALHDGVIRGDVRRPELAGAVLLKLAADQIDPDR